MAKEKPKRVSKPNKEEKSPQNELKDSKDDSEDKKTEEYELIIKPTEGVQTTFYSIKEGGGKIGRHSSNQMVILEESVSRFHAEIIFQSVNYE